MSQIYWAHDQPMILRSTFAWHELVDTEVTFKITRCPETGAINLIGGEGPSGNPHTLQLDFPFKAPHTSMGDVLRGWGNHPEDSV